MNEDYESGSVVSERYRIEKTLGKGGMGVVYQAYDLQLDRYVALKMIHPYLAADPDFARRFQVEARAVARLDHPNLLRIHDYNIESGAPYMVTQYLEGETLQARLSAAAESSRVLSFGEAAIILLDVCEGLGHAHEQYIVHRDIKPSNLILLPQGRVVVMDFGVAKMADSTSVTAAGSVIGTALYMAPEQIKGETLDGRADLYSLGVILFEMLAGRCPFLADNYSALMLMHLNSPVPDLSKLNENLPPECISIVEKSLAKERDERFQTAGEMAAALRERLQTSETLTVVAPSPEPPRNVTPDETSQKLRLIHYDHKSQEDKLRRLLDEFAESLCREEVTETVGHEFVKRAVTKIGEVDRRLAADFNIVVLGDFKRGKSTFINALLGSPIATTDVTPETVTINRIGYGPKLKIEACFADGGRFALKPDELKSELLSKLITRLPQRPSHLQIEAPLEWLRGIQFVDTPGLNDFLGNYDELVHDYLRDADALLYVVSALSPLSESERAFLRHTLRPYEFSKVCFLLNRLDALDTESDVMRVVEATRNKLLGLFPNARLFGVSALREFQTVQVNVKPKVAAGDYLDASFKELRGYLQDSLILNRDLVQVERAVVFVNQLLLECEADVRRLKTSIEASKTQIEELIGQCDNRNSDLYQKIEAHKERIHAQVKDMGEQTTAWMRDFTERFRQQVIAQLDKFKNEDVQKHFSFFLSDIFHTALTQCLDAHQSSIAEALHADDHILSALGRDGNTTNTAAVDALEDVRDFAMRAGFNGGEWNAFDNVQLALRFAGFDGMLWNLMAGLLNRTLSAGENLSRYRIQLNQCLPELETSVAGIIKEKYEEVAARTEQLVDTAYQQQIASVLSSLHQARELRSAGEQKTSEANSAIDNILNDIERTRAAVQEFQRQLQEYGQSRIVELLDE